MTTPIANVDNTTLNNLTPNLDTNDIADPALRKAAFQYIYTEMQTIITAYNAFIAAGGIATGNLADLSVTTAKLADLAVTTGKIPDLAIVTAKINDLAVTAGKIALGTITSAQIADLSIATGDLADALITTAKLADLNVTTGKLADASVTLAKMAAASVGTTHLVDGSVTNAKIASGVITADKFVAGALNNDTQNGLLITALQAETTAIANFYGNYTTLQNAINGSITDKKILKLPTGTITVNNISIDGSIIIEGQGIGKTILQSNNLANIFLEIAKNNSVENVVLRDLSIYGDATSLGGVAFGTTAAYYIAYCVFERVEIKSFSKVSAYGVSLNRAQEIHFIDEKIDSNYDNIYRPTGGYVTTCTFSGQAGHIGLAVRYGAYINDTTNGSIKFRDQIFEGNASNAIYSPTGTKCVLEIDGGYFEGNNVSAGTAAIDIGGSNADAYSQSSLVLNGCEFHTSGNPALPVVKLDRVMWRVYSTTGLFNQTVTTTANTKGIFIPDIQGDAVNYETVIEALLGSHCAIVNSVVNGLVFIGNINFVSGLTVSQMFGAGGNGINMPNIGIGELPNTSRQFKVANANPVMQLKVLGGTADKSKWDIRGVGTAGSESLSFNSVNDAETVAVPLAKFSATGNMGIGFTGNNMPNANAILDLSSTTTKAFLPPVMTTTQKNAIASPTAGMVVYDSSLSKLCVYTGAAWQTITSA